MDDIKEPIDDYSPVNIQYDKGNGVIKLFPTPDYDSTAGLKIFVSRTPKQFATTDTDAEPGFSPLFHRYLSYYAALDYASKYKPERVSELYAKLQEIKQNMEDFYISRDGDGNDIEIGTIAD